MPATKQTNSKNDNKVNMVRQLTQACLWVVLAFFPLTMLAESDSASVRPLKHDTTILFRFVPGNRIFYSPYKGNDAAILLAAQLIEQHRKDIISGKAYILIRGFCGSFGSREANLAAAKERSNHVKSWFITHYGMKEENYRTRNSTYSYNGMKDIVALMGLQFVEGYDPLAEQRAGQARRDSLERLRADSLAALEQQRAEAERLAQLRADSLARAEEARRRRMADSLAALPRRVYETTPWYIKSNLLYDAVLMPSLEVEYRFNKRWSAAVEGNMAWWHRNSKHKYYQLATILPEVRYWFKPQGNRRGHYVGLFGGGGWYDLENGDKGYKGEGGMAGVSYGYMFPVGKYLAFEAGLGVGFLTTEYEEYLPIDGHYVYQQTERTNYFGPLKLKFALVWNIGRWIDKKGGKQ